MAQSPRHIDVLTEDGVTRVPIVYTRPFTQVVRGQTCALFGIAHKCDAERCWDRD